MIDYDLVIVGAGSGNMLPMAEIEDLRVAIIERDRFGGTCLNRGCIPSKMLVHVADIAETVRTAGRYGIRAELRGADWSAIRDRIFTRLDESAADGLEYRRGSGVDVYLEDARFVAAKVLQVGDEQIRGERMILAAGARPTVPEIPGLDETPFHTTDTIMRVDALPESIVIIGGGSIAAELGHVFAAFGTDVTIVEKESHLLATLDDDVAQQFTESSARRFDVRLEATVVRVEPTAEGVAVHLEGGPRPGVVRAETLLVAVGRTPNSDELDVAASGIAVDEQGRVIIDDFLATNVPGVFAIGDLTNRLQLKHVANVQMRLATHNVLHPDDLQPARFPVIPAAVFADPQVATVGPTERALREQGTSFVASRREYSDTAFGWALENTTGFVKLLADPETRRLLAAHIVGPQAAALMQPLVQAICLDNTVDQLAHDVLYIHPAPTEAVSQALFDIAGAGSYLD
jgi:mycothione reductase